MMKKFIKISCIVICLLLSAPVLSGAKEYDGDRGRISYVEPYSNWYYVYDENNDRIGSISNQEGELIGYSETVIILKKFNFYYFYDSSLERYGQKPVDAIGDIVSVSSSGFIARKQGREIQYNLKGERL